MTLRRINGSHAWTPETCRQTRLSREGVVSAPAAAQLSDLGRDCSAGPVAPRPDDLAGLIVRSGRGESKAFAELYDATSTRIYGLVLRLVRSAEHAERVTRLVYVNIWRESGRYVPAAGNALAWLITLAHHSAVEQIRVNDSDPKPGQPAIGRPELNYRWSDARRPQPDAPRLTTVQQDILTLIFLGGYSHRQVSQMLGVPVVMVTRAGRDGLLGLRNQLQTAS